MDTAMTDFQLKAVMKMVLDIIRTSKDLKEAEERALNIIEDKSKSPET